MTVNLSGSNVVNVDPYLRMHWHFTDDKQLFTELARSMNEVAIVTNMRTIGTFPVSLPAITGEQWFIQGGNRQQQTLRQVFMISGIGTIPVSLNLSNFGGFTKIYGTFTDGTNWYPLPWVDTVSATNQITLSVVPTADPNICNLTITAGAGAPPTITSGTVILEWLSQM